LLYLSYEAVSCYHALYNYNKIAPKAIAMIRVFGFSCQWTDFRDPNGPLLKTLKLNKAGMPEYVYISHNQPLKWDNYLLCRKNKFNFDTNFSNVKIWKKKQHLKNSRKVKLENTCAALFDDLAALGINPPTSFDLSDVGNYIGQVVSKYIEDNKGGDIGFDKDDFLYGLRHGLGL
jgi:hypothetical protein